MISRMHLRLPSLATILLLLAIMLGCGPPAVCPPPQPPPPPAPPTPWNIPTTYIVKDCSKDAFDSLTKSLKPAYAPTRIAVPQDRSCGFVLRDIKTMDDLQAVQRILYDWSTREKRVLGLTDATVSFASVTGTVGFRVSLDGTATPDALVFVDFGGPSVQNPANNQGQWTAELSDDDQRALTVRDGWAYILVVKGSQKQYFRKRAGSQQAPIDFADLPLDSMLRQK